MTGATIRKSVAPPVRPNVTDYESAVLSTIAPEIDPATVDRSGELQFEFDLDSMDFLNLVEGVARATGRAIPERDYAALATVDAFVDYLAAPDG
jgi:acyl carrier protein